MSVDAVDDLSAPRALKELLEWIGNNRAVALLCPQLIPLAALGQITHWLGGEPMPAEAEAKVRVTLKIVHALEPIGGLHRTLVTLDEPVGSSRISFLEYIASLSPHHLDMLLTQVQEWANGRQ